MVVCLLVFIIVLLAVALCLMQVRHRKGMPADDDADYLDEEGNHVYYDRKLIRHKERRR